MKTTTITQGQKDHDPNALHDAFVAAGLIPLLAENTVNESRYTFDDAVSDQAINTVVASYTFTPKPPPVDIKTTAQNFRAAVNGATTLPQLKQVLINELDALLKELSHGRLS